MSLSKNTTGLLAKLGVSDLNDMQETALQIIPEKNETVLLAPTGSGKTIAFLLPVILNLNPDLKEAQVLILAPSRELALQIEQVCRDMGSGYKVNAVYGGRPIIKDKIELQKPPAILIGTPGRLADHIERKTISFDHIHTLILDEFDKSLEIGFEEDMSLIAESLKGVNKKILTSATDLETLPYFMEMRAPEKLNFLKRKSEGLNIRLVEANKKDKLDALVKLLHNLEDKNGIIFCNFKSTIDFVSEHLNEQRIPHTNFHGGLEQIERERSLIKFRNGTHHILLATDLAARGIDVPQMDYIIHYQLPPRKEEFVHRNGRTARMHDTGSAYVLNWKEAELADFINDYEIFALENKQHKFKKQWETLFISGGRKDKISKGDIAGLFMKQGGLNKEELGLIELKYDCAFVSVKRSKAKATVSKIDNSRLKKKKVRIRIID